MSPGRRRRGACAALLTFGLLLALPGGAEPAAARPLEVPPTAGWQHAETGLVLRARLAGLPRTAIEDNTATELDVIVTYAAPDEATVVTLYLFRPALMSVPVWFDRSETMILLRDEYRGPQPVGGPRAFAPPSSVAASALRRTYLTGSAYPATGLAVLPLDEWLLAIRISSRDADPVALDARLDTVIAALGWPAGVAEAAPATVVAACAKPLEYARRAKLRRPSMTDALLGSTLLGIVAERSTDDTAEKGPPPVFCRDAPGTVEYGVYRNAADADRESYVMALADAGRIVSLSPSLSVLVDGPKGYMLSFGDLDRTLIFPNFDKLAAPDKALEAVTTTAPISSAMRGADGGSTINISSDIVE